MQTLNDVKTWRGMKVVDADGERIGTIEDVFLDRQTGEPEFATVKTGLFGLKSNFVPIRDAEIIGDNEVRVPYKKEQVKDAPKIEADGELSPEEERRLWEHYGRSDYDEWQGDDRTTALDLPDQAEEQSHGAAIEEPVVAVVRLRRIVVAPIGDDRSPDRA
jgi:sporulation protein YlmC with PRC-barrel domain